MGKSEQELTLQVLLTACHQQVRTAYICLSQPNARVPGIEMRSKSLQVGLGESHGGT